MSSQESFYRSVTDQCKKNIHDDMLVRNFDSAKDTLDEAKKNLDQAKEEYECAYDMYFETKEALANERN